MESFEYVFTALRGRQAGREYYIAMCPLKLVPKIFLFQEEEIPPELRSQRTLNKARIPEIASYMLANREEYIFSSITASIDGNAKFDPLPVDGTKTDDVGKLRISMDARFIINDGQHRRAAIEKALHECPDLGDETISVVFFIDIGLKRTQQMFAISTNTLFGQPVPSGFCMTIEIRCQHWQNLLQIKSTFSNI